MQKEFSNTFFTNSLIEEFNRNGGEGRSVYSQIYQGKAKQSFAALVGFHMSLIVQCAEKMNLPTLTILDGLPGSSSPKIEDALLNLSNFENGLNFKPKINLLMADIDLKGLEALHQATLRSSLDTGVTPSSINCLFGANLPLKDNSVDLLIFNHALDDVIYHQAMSATGIAIDYYQRDPEEIQSQIAAEQTLLSYITENKSSLSLSGTRALLEESQRVLNKDGFMIFTHYPTVNWLKYGIPFYRQITQVCADLFTNFRSNALGTAFGGLLTDVTSGFEFEDFVLDETVVDDVFVLERFTDKNLLVLQKRSS